MAKIHVIPHTHWDREWYFTQQDSDVLAAYNFTKVIETLEEQPEYSCYHLDGQSSIVEDYLKVLPHMRERLAQLVVDKQLFIGPWYTQTDTYNVAGESIIRNLKYGMHIAESLGHSMKVGYLPDTFGHNAQMPTLFKGTGIDNIIFWRGIDYDQQVERSNFNWRSAGGDEIYAYNLVHGYGAAKNMVATSEHLDKKIFPMVEKIKSLSGLNEVLIPSGGDQVNIDPELPKTLQAATQRSPDNDVYAISSMEAFVDVLRANSDSFETYDGEFKAPRYARIHKTIGSVRYDIKKLNFDIEQFLIKKLEVVVAIAKAQGITVHTELIDIAWKKILECHAHDSIGGCNSDATNADIMHRLKQAQEICHGLYNLVIKEIASSCHDDELMLFNGQLQPYTGFVKAVVFSSHENIVITDGQQECAIEVIKRETLDGGKVIEVTKDGEKEVSVPPYYRFELKISVNDLPAMGYQVFEVQRSNQSNRKVEVRDQTSIENGSLMLTCEGSQLQLVDKNTNRVIPQLLTFEEQADDGDSYDFSPLRGDTPLYNQTIELIETQIGDTEQVMKVRATLDIPVDLDARVANQNDHQAVFDVMLTLCKDNQQLVVSIVTINQAKDHRVRVLVNSDVQTNTSICTLPFALMERPVEPSISGWEKSFRECPIAVETTDGAVALASENKALVINGSGLKEFQVIKGEHSDKIALTLFKSTGVLGKDDLAWRPGRASGINNTVVHTPDAQLQKSMQFSFALALTEDAHHSTVRKLERQYLDVPFSYQKQTLNSFENRLERFQVRFDARDRLASFSLLSMTQALELSSIGHSFYKKEAVIIRLFNPTDSEVDLDLNAFGQFKQIELVDYREQPKLYTGSGIDTGGQSCVVKPNNSIDVRVTFNVAR
ncbi:glycoside hydrolase family 38 C-terminal domain-containing protein [Vibrio crassostreae]|uniref:glycoside hydrolase family 38 N-terminal domain-containing protein n=1 Tax=Vibrio crassostreae TaxID=246167 RepID=UPI00104D17E4|nr:glycoside hydrolase family 38 C-terminal domain-containing protein [Vibrio crassostreae]TCW20242.1 alpha-mannosidase [Vibrio crassostreae]CAK3842479.1 mannosylglycerate hydrolase [Vibrio crassostreae]